MRISHLVFGISALSLSATSLAGGRIELRLNEDVTHEQSVFELGLPIRAAVSQKINYVSWTGYACNPEAAEYNVAKTEQGIEIPLKHVTVGLGGKLEYAPELKKLEKSLYASVSAKLW